MKKILNAKPARNSRKPMKSSATMNNGIAEHYHKSELANTTNSTENYEISLDKFYSQISSNKGDDWKCPWTDELCEVFSGFLKLGRVWDGYDGERVSKKTIIEAMKLLTKLYRPKIKAPCVAPNGEGSMVMDWFYSDFEIMVCVNVDGEIEGCLKNLKYDVADSRRYDEFESYDIEKCLPQIRKWFSKIL